MGLSSDYRSSAFMAAPRSEEPPMDALQARVSAEFREMPGLMLTLAQAPRLYSIEIVQCDRVLTTLVGRGVLATNGRVSQI